MAQTMEWSIAMMFDPKQHMGNLKGKDYLEVKWRLVWYRDVYKNGRIETEVIATDPLVVKATVYDDGGMLLATGHGSAQANTKAVWSGREIEKAETAAIGRALAHAGFGTQFTDEDEGDNIVDSPVERGTPTPPKTAKKGANSAFSKKQDTTPTSDANGAEIESGGDGQLQAAAWVQNGLRRQRFMQYAMGEEFGNLQVSEVYEALGIVEDLTEYEGDEQRAMACMVAYASGYEPDAINTRIDAMAGADDFKANLRAVALSMTALGTMDF